MLDMMDQEQWAKSYRQAFPMFRIYLDNIDTATQKQIQNRMTLLGATIEPFFSNKCTHIVTTKPIPSENNVLGDNRTNKDDILEKASKWNIKTWSLEKLQNILNTLLNQHSTGHRTERARERGLVHLLKEEKLHGPSTSYGKSAAGDKRVSQPVFVPFRHRYVLVEEKSGRYRPVIMKEYEKNDKTPTWPVLRRTPSGKSPFMIIPKPAEDTANDDGAPPKDTVTATATEKNKENMTKGHIAQENAGQENRGQENEGQENETLENQPEPMDISPLRQNTAQPLQPHQTANTCGIPSLDTAQNLDHTQFSPSLRASGFHASFTQSSRATLATGTASPTFQINSTFPTSRFISTSESLRFYASGRRLPPGDNVVRLDRRMVDNHLQTTDTTVQAATLAQAANEAEAAKRDQERAKREEELAKAKAKRKLEMDMNWCEICSKRYLDLKEHLQEKEHQAFVTDENNFKQLDALLTTIRREYKSPLPIYMKSTVDPSIDGHDVKFERSNKRPNNQLDSPLSSPTKRMSIE